VSAINNIPHAEEHSAGVRLEARITPMQPYSRCSLQCRSGPAVRERLSKRLEAGAGAALDAGGDQPLDVEAVADQFEDAQLLLAGLAIGGRDIAGNRISR